MASASPRRGVVARAHRLLVGLGLKMGDHVEHALLDLGIARDLGELPILSGHLAEEIFLISHRGLPRYPHPAPADLVQNESRGGAGRDSEHFRPTPRT